MTTSQKENRHTGVISARGIQTLQRMCTFTVATRNDIIENFNELCHTLSKGPLKISETTSSSSRRPRGRRDKIVLKDSCGYREPYDRPCTWVRKEKQCWLISELDPWNRVLSRNCVELREHSWGELTLRGFNWPDNNIPDVRDALQISLLLHLLLRQHRCVTRVLMDQTVTFLEMEVFWQGLQIGGAGVRYLKFSGSLSDQYPARRYFDMRLWSNAAVRLPVLHTLEVWRVDFDDEVARRLGSYLKRTTTLKCIAFHDLEGTEDAAIAFLEYLCDNKTVTSLTLPEFLVMTKGGVALEHVLRSHVSLKHLEISGSDDGCPPTAVLRGAMASCSLKSLTVHCFTILAEDIETMAAVLTLRPASYASVTGTDTAQLSIPTSCLESLAFLDCATRDQRLQRAYATLIGGALVKLKINTCNLNEAFSIDAASRLQCDSRLRVLDVTDEELSASSICALVQALEVNSTLEKLAFDLYGSLPDSCLFTLFNTIREIGASSRIDINWSNPRPLLLAQGRISLRRISELLINLDKQSVEDATKIMEHLASTTNVTSVCIQSTDPVEPLVVQQLADALGKTKSIRNLSLLLDWPENSIGTVLRSLEQNRSVSVLNLKWTTFSKRASKALGRLVERNRMLHKLFVDLKSEAHGGVSQLRTICRELKEAVTFNRFLTNVAVNTRTGNGVTDFVIKDALRRNRILFNQAVHFVKGSDSKKDALAFDTLQYSRTVLTDLCKDSEEEAAAKEKIDKARIRLAVNYFIYTGVVKAKIACYPHPKGKPTFNKLGKDVHALIASYLSLTDVIDI